MTHGTCPLNASSGGRLGRRPVIELHTQLEVVRLQRFLDLVQRLLAQVRRLHQLHLGALHQIADVVDILGRLNVSSLTVPYYLPSCNLTNFRLSTTPQPMSLPPRCGML